MAGHPRVYEMLAGHVDEVNKSLAEEPLMAASQIKPSWCCTRNRRRRRRTDRTMKCGAA